MDLEEKIFAWYKQLHANPELGFCENQTAKLCASELRQLGYTVKENIAKTGIIAELTKGSAEKVIMLRADMDALPISENTGLPYASTNGAMHACGHDSHMAMILGASTILKDVDFNGTLRIAIQPCEESEDENGMTGAGLMIQQGVLQNVNACIGLHVDNMIPVGSMYINKDQVVNASSNPFYIEVMGKSSHGGATPHLGVDAIVISAEIITALQSIVSRKVSPHDTAVLSIGTINGGEAQNIISQKVVMKGVIRTLNVDAQKIILENAKSMVESIAKMHGGSATFNIVTNLPTNVNDKDLAQMAINIAQDMDLVVNEEYTSMGAEDFSLYSQQVPTLFAKLGASINPDNPHDVAPLHHPNAQLNKDAFILGAKFFVQMTTKLLS